MEKVLHAEAFPKNLNSNEHFDRCFSFYPNERNHTMQVSNESAKMKKRNVPKPAKVRLSDLTPKKEPKVGVGVRLITQTANRFC